MPNMLYELQDRLHTNVKKIYGLAVRYAKEMKHKAVTEEHLLLGILALGNTDRNSSVPRYLRELGADCGVLYDLLNKDKTLRSTVPGHNPELDAQAMATFQQAAAFARERLGQPSANYSVITSDLLASLLLSKGPRMEQALAVLKLDKEMVQRRADLRTTPSDGSWRHLRVLN